MKRSLMLVCMLFALHANSQINFANYKLGDSYIFDDTFKLLTDDIFTTYKSQFGLDGDDSIAFRQEQYGQLAGAGRGYMFSSYQQYYKGYEVMGKILSTVSKCNVTFIVNGPFASGLDIDVSAPITEADALDSALAYLHAPMYVWEDTATENSLKISREDSLATFYPKGRLLITKNDGIDTPTNYELCWHFQITYIDTTTTPTGLTHLPEIL